MKRWQPLSAGVELASLLLARPSAKGKRMCEPLELEGEEEEDSLGIAVEVSVI